MFGHDDHKDDEDVTTIEPATNDTDATTTDTSTVADDAAVTSDVTTSDTVSTEAPTSDYSIDATADSSLSDDSAATTTAEPAETVTETEVDSVSDTTPAEDGTPEVTTTDTEETTVTDTVPSIDTPSVGDGSTSTDSDISVPEVDDTPVVSEVEEETITSTQPLTPSFGGGSHDDLLDLKKDALEELAPLVDKLDQSPEEKFRTTMMMIQASDASDLVKSAYEAAQKITDEKVRAQALLDIVNEINYFTQKDTTN